MNRMGVSTSTNPSDSSAEREDERKAARASRGREVVWRRRSRWREERRVVSDGVEGEEGEEVDLRGKGREGGPGERMEREEAWSSREARGSEEEERLWEEGRGERVPWTEMTDSRGGGVGVGVDGVGVEVGVEKREEGTTTWREPSRSRRVRK